MSKIGQLPIEIPNGVTVTIDGNTLSVVGPKGTLTLNFSKELEIKTIDSKVTVSIKKDSKFARSVWGTTRMLIANNIKGVTEGWKKQLELVGTGYRSEVQGNTLVLTVGYSHPVIIEAPVGITF